ncbi:MAG: T9SS C-terminal target domain-containing protein [Cytophagales bacterium]|nr:MAG: T9SS C-terminal target domain-containing protein [Cytophagales bacterium]
MKKIYFLFFLYFLISTNHALFGQTNVFPVETMGNVSSTTAISAHTGWVNNGTLTFSGTGDVRNTTNSTGYTGVSGGANVFLTTSSARSFQIGNINTSSYTSLSLSFGVYKGTTAIETGTSLAVEVSTDGTSYSPLSFPVLPTGIGTASWYLRTATGTIPSTSNLRIRFTNSSTTTQFRLDDVQLQGTLVASNTISAPSTISNVTLANCTATQNINVNVTSIGTFTSGNQYTAQLSDALGSFASPLATASITSISNSPGTIVLTVPAGTLTGTGYLIRVISNNPSIIGSNSNTFTITQNGTCTSVTTDYFRSKQTGNWNIAGNWQSSADNINWVNATLVPDNLANNITILTGHTITMTDARTFDQTFINGTLIFGANAIPTIANGAGTDLTINGGGILEYNGTANSIVTTFTGDVLVNSNGILRYTVGFSGGSIAENLAGTSTNPKVVYANGGIFEWNNTGGFGSSSITYFSTSVGSDIPVFRITQIVSGVGSNIPNDLSFNGVFEANSNITFTNSATKFFRNGIRGTGTITQQANSGKLIINGTNAELSGITLALDGTNGISLENNANINVNNNITLTSGLFRLLNSDLNLNGRNLNVNGGIIQEDLANNYTILDNTATTEANKGGAVNYTATATNTATNFFGLGLSLNHNGTGDYSVNVQRLHYSAAAGNGIKRIYQITGTPTGTSTMTINYASSELGIVSEPLNISRWQSGTGWENYSPTNADYSIKSLTYNNVTAFSHWTLSGQNNPLPVSLLSFNVMQTNDNQTNITWQTATEVNNNRFEIWKSINGFDYVLIYTKDGQNNSAQIKNYNFIDNQFNENSYYQLKQIDNDGKINDLGIKFINKKQENLNEIYPNPINEKIEIKNETPELKMILFNQTGQKIWEGDDKNNLQNQFDSLPKGQYLIQFQNKNKIHYQKIIK